MEGSVNHNYKSTTDTASFTKELDITDADIISLQTVINSMTGTSVDVKLEHSIDGVNWFDVGGAVNAQFTSAGSDLDKSSGTHVAGKVRINVTMVSITALDIEIYVVAHDH